MKKDGVNSYLAVVCDMVDCFCNFGIGRQHRETLTPRDLTPTGGSVKTA